MIARVWRGIVPVEKAAGYRRYLAESERGLPDYRRIPGNLGCSLLERALGDRVEFVMISLWRSRDAIAAYAGPDIDRAQYFPYDLECLIEPEREVAHYEVVVSVSSIG